MDLILTLIIVIGISIYKIKRIGGLEKETPPILQEDGSIKYSNKKDIPIGNNLMLKQEIEPFTFIIKQMGL